MIVRVPSFQQRWEKISDDQGPPITRSAWGTVGRRQTVFAGLRDRGPQLSLPGGRDRPHRQTRRGGEICGSEDASRQKIRHTRRVDHSAQESAPYCCCPNLPSITKPPRRRLAYRSRGSGVHAQRETGSGRRDRECSQRTMNNLLVIVGPTAVGKSAIAIELAQRLGGEIVSADSRYLYRGMDIGTAKPTPADRARVPHHLIDVTDPDQPWSLAQFRDAADVLIGEINRRGRLPILVGGTGQYIHALLEGWSIPRRAADPQLRAGLAAIVARDGGDELYRRLQQADPAAAASIDRRNVRRVVRALEVTLTTGVAFSAQRQKNPPDYRSLLIGLAL